MALREMCLSRELYKTLPGYETQSGRAKEGVMDVTLLGGLAACLIDKPKYLINAARLKLCISSLFALYSRWQRT